ncbi:proteinase B, partial [Coemansia sp. RSA 1694]
MYIKSLTVVVVAVFATAVAGSPMRSTVVSTAPLLASYDTEVIPDSYIVVFKDDVAPGNHALQSHFAWLANNIHEANARAPAFKDANRINHIYKDAIVGYSGQFEPEILERIRHSSDVAYV